jgi:hypothetical protein
MNPGDLSEQLDLVLPDDRIVADASRLLREELARGGFASDPPESIPPADAPIELVSKVFIRFYYPHVFGNHFICRVAIGGIQSAAHGVVKPGYFFASLYYSAALELITVDFHDEHR